MSKGLISFPLSSPYDTAVILQVGYKAKARSRKKALVSSLWTAESLEQILSLQIQTSVYMRSEYQDFIPPIFQAGGTESLEEDQSH